MRIRLGLLLLAVLVPAPALAKDDPEPPHHLPVFRCVLDGNPRMVVIPLHRDMWLAYDAKTCSLYKAWHGGVKLDGAVYTTVHGPQPTSTGPAYLLDRAAGAWFEGDGTSGKRLTPRFLGYRIDRGKVTLRYRLRAGKRTYRVEETPTYAAGPDGAPQLMRKFRFDPAPVEGAFCWKLRAGFVQARETNADIEGSAGNKEVRMLPAAGRAQTWVRFTYDVKAAERQYRIEQELQELAREEARRKAAEGEPKKPIEAHPQDTPIGNGVSVRVYWIDTPMSRLRTLVPGQTPNVSHVLPVLDLRTERKDFGGVQEHFITHVDGFLEIAQAGSYGFRLISDDGSRFFLNDKVVIDHDGLHGSTAKEGEVELAPGRHKLFVEHFENGGGEQLTLEWKPPGAGDWMIVPNSALRAPVGEVRVTSPGPKKIEEVRRRGTPGDGQPLDAVHPAYDLLDLRPEGFEPRVGGIDFLPDGRLVLCCWEPDGGVYVLDGVQGDDRSKIAVKRIAAGLAEPLGLRVVDGRLFVLQKQELTELIDHDGDGTVDEYRCVAAGWGVTANFHEFAFGLVYKDKHFYATLATAIDPGGASTQPQDPDRGKVVKIALDGDYEFVAHGLRTPNGIGLGIDDEIFVTDNQGDWLPVSKLVHVQAGAFYGGRSVDPAGTKDTPETPPVVWLPQGEIGNSPSEPGLLVGGPYEGQMLHGDVTHGGLKRVFVERVRGRYQGCVFRFTQGLEGGVNRWRTGPDGALYVGGIGSSGNWGQEGKQTFGLQRLKPNGKRVFDVVRVRAAAGRRGFHVDFSEPLAPAAGGQRGDYELQQWRYEPTADYGGPKLDRKAVEVTGVSVGTDRRSVYVETTGLEEGRVVHLRFGRTVRNAAGQRPWSKEAWYTLNQTEEGKADAQRLPPAPPHNHLTAAEHAAGWELLFDGRTLTHWRGYKKSAVPDAWKVARGAIHFSKQGRGGDIITQAQYSDFELSLEWKIAEGGNSGICYRLSEDGGAMWQTGPEYQVLDNGRHPDGGGTRTSAGANYALHAPRFDVTRAPGAWNQARIVVKGTHVEHWLNGWKLLEYEVGSEDWKARLAKSKFAKTQGWGVQPEGHIGLQDHGDEVWYRNIKIRRLK